MNLLKVEGMTNTTNFKIDGRNIGVGEPTFIIAEIGVNHNGDVNLAHKMIDAAADAGADAVKFQTIDPDSSYVPGTPSYEVFSDASFVLGQYREFVEHCREREIVFFTTPGDWPSLEMCSKLSLPVIKISSGLMTNSPIVMEAAQMGVPLIISTGGAYLWEVGQVVHELESVGKDDFALLHCVSIYPADDDRLNLRSINTMQQAFPYPIGYSDHSMGRTASISAVTLGACLIEKHFTLSRDLAGGDNSLSSEPQEFSAMVREIRACEKMQGDYDKRPHDSESEFRSRFRRRLVANHDILEGDVLTAQSIGLKRPLDPVGLSPSLYREILGKRASRTIQQHEPITWDCITET